MKKIVILIVGIFLILFTWTTYKEYFFVEEKNLKMEDIKKPKKEVINEIETVTKIPIIVYHYVREADKNSDLLGWNLSINPSDFEKQLAYLKEQGYKSAHLGDLVDGKVPEKSIVLSFDDGLSDFYTAALPLLQKYGFTASNGIITDMIGSSEHMTIDQIKACVAAGIEITSHSLNHPNMAGLSEMEVRRQLTKSRDYLKKNFEVDVVGFVYPSGKYNDLVLKILKEEGYKIAVTTEYGEADLAVNNMLLLPRIRIDNRDSFDGFVKKLEKL